VAKVQEQWSEGREVRDCLEAHDDPGCEGKGSQKPGISNQDRQIGISNRRLDPQQRRWSYYTRGGRGAARGLQGDQHKLSAFQFRMDVQSSPKGPRNTH